MSVCAASIRAAFGSDSLSEKEIAALQRDLRRRSRELRAQDASLSDNDALAAAGAEFASQAERRALVQKRNTLLGLRARMQAVDFIKTNFGDNYAEGLKALLVGVQSAKVGARRSAANEIQTLQNQYLAGLMANIGRVDGGLEVLASGTMDDEIARVLWALNTPGAKLDGMDVRALAIGKAVHKWQEAARTNANMAGAWIGKLPGYIVTQSHDTVRIMADRDGWMAMMRERADLPRMMGEQGMDNVDELLSEIWKNLADGVHLKSMPPEGQAGKGLRGMARGLSQERVIHFKSADDWSAYNKAYGGGNLRESLIGGLQNMARATGLMRVLGPNHEDSYNRIVQELLASEKAKGGATAGKLSSTAERYRKTYLAELDGSLDVPGNNPLATWGAGIRAWQNMSALGGSLLSSVGDLGVMMAGAKYAGRNGFEMVTDGLGNMFKSAPSAERLGLYADLGLALESMSSKFATNRFSVDDGVRGALGTMQKAFFKFNLQNRWTDSMRMSIAEFLSSNLARNAGKAFGELDDRLATTLRLYGIDEGRWDIMRTAGLDEMDGRQFLVPSAMKDIDEVPLSAYLRGQGKDATPAAVASLRREIEHQFRAYFVDQNGYMLLTPDAATRGLMKLGSQRGTVLGEGVRMVMQFKSFSLAFSQRVLGREIKQGGITGVAGLMVWSALAGYAAMTLKDLSKGKVNQWPDDPVEAGKLAMRALSQGGGLGIYGEILTSQVTNRGYDASSALLGPTYSDVAGSQGIAGIAARAYEGRDPSAAAVRFVQSNTPFLNLFYTKLAMDYLVFWNLQEAVNPGSLARTERTMERDYNQQFLISPSRDRFELEQQP